MTRTAPTPVFVLTGFLGSGKTTLLNRLVRNDDFRDSAIIVNEFGAIGLDHRLIATAKDNILLLDAGCLCCVLVDSLRETLADLYQRRASGAAPPFARVLIETSGLADPAPLLQTIMKDGIVAPLFRVGGVLTLVDALHGAAQIAEHDEARAQIAMADRMVLTKTENATFPALAALRQELARLNPSADVRDAPADDALIAALFVIDRIGATPPRGHVRHDSGIGTESFHIERPVSWAGISAWTGHLRERYGDDLLRVKALLPRASGGQALIQGVRRLFDITRADDIALADGVAVLIGRGLDRAALLQGLAWLDAPEGTGLPSSRGFAPWASEAAA